MIENIIIRQETKLDYIQVFELIKNTFKNAEHSDGNEHYLVERLRKSESFIPELSLVAEYNKKIIGHILFTEVKVGNTTQLALAPLTVLTDFQRRGIGKTLLKKDTESRKILVMNTQFFLGIRLIIHVLAMFQL